VPKVKQPKPTEKVDNKKKREYGENGGGVDTNTTEPQPDKKSGEKISSGSLKTTPVNDAKNVIDKSPTLQKQLKDLQNKGWKIEYNESGKGSYLDKKNKKIVVDKTGGSSAITRTLSHEKGHALYKADPYVPPTGLAKEEYVGKNVKRHLKDEGEATLSNIEIRDEILSNGGPDIGISGTKKSQYEKIYEEYKETGNRDKAREKIGDVFADGERPSTNPSLTYREYYGKAYEDYYDKFSKPK
jgi:hypothetical protein